MRVIFIVFIFLFGAFLLSAGINVVEKKIASQAEILRQLEAAGK